MIPRSIVLTLTVSLLVGAQTWTGNHDESRVKPYTLPDPLVFANGEKVRSAKDWKSRRRPEVLRLFEENQHGRTPAKKITPTFELDEIDKAALGGKAIRKQITMSFTGHPSGPRIAILVYLPAKAPGPVPVFVGLNFNGNHTVDPDPGIRLPEVWNIKTKAKERGREDTRGQQASRWQIARVLDRGYGVATAYYGDVEPDFDGSLKSGVRGMFLQPGQTAFEENEWGAVAAWAWGLSRIADYLVTDRGIDSKRIAVTGHSRLGKAALWAGALDSRFGIVISNDSGEGGAALSKRNFGEDVGRLNDVFPHWFARSYRRYNGHEDQLPVDAHMLLALIAPRPVYVASAADDLHADPRGEFLAAVHAGPVYELLGTRSLGTDRMPPTDHPIHRTIGYHVRTGKHDVTAYDWDRFCDFADLHWTRR